MGAGDNNGHNFGGLHTGCGKGGRRGPYSAGGFRPNTEISHLDFLEGDVVYYIGTQKHNRNSKRLIQNGDIGSVMLKDKTDKRVPRSKIRVDFGERGICYVEKKLLQHEDDYEIYLDELLDKESLTEGYQSFRVEARKEEGSKETKAKKVMEEESCVKRNEMKEFRQKKKLFNHVSKLQMEADIQSLSDNGGENRRIERLISILKEDIKDLVVDSEEYLSIRKKIKDLNGEQFSLKKQKAKLEYMYAQGMYVKNAHSPETFYLKVQEFAENN